MTKIKKSFVKEEIIREDVKVTKDNKSIEKKEKDFAKEKGAIIINRRENYPKTGDWKKEIPVVDLNRCVGCGICAQHCPENTIQMEEIKGKRKAIIKYDFCKGCGVCAEVCPHKVIKMKK